MSPHLYYWAIGLSPAVMVLVISLVGRSGGLGSGFNRGFWQQWYVWLPALELGALVLTVDGIYSAHEHFWLFTAGRFAAGRYAGLPLAEYAFFLVGAVMGVRLLQYATGLWQPGQLVRHRPALRTFWLIMAATSLVFGQLNHGHARTHYVYGLLLPWAIVLAALLPSFYTRSIQLYFAVGEALFLGMDMLMNHLDSFTHNWALTSGLKLYFGVPFEDVGYVLIVLILMFILAQLAAKLAGRRQPIPTPA